MTQTKTKTYSSVEISQESKGKKIVLAFSKKKEDSFSFVTNIKKVLINS